MDRIFIYLTDLSGNLSYGIIFGILVACGLGFPLPEDIPLIASGYLVWDGTMTWTGAISVTLTGVLIGDTILFFLGRRLGMKVLEQGRIQMFTPKRVRRTRAYFRKYGDKLVFFARFVAGFRAAAFFMAGAMRMTFRRFILLDALAALVSVPVWIAIGYAMGYYLGDEISEITKQMHNLKRGISIGVFVILIFVIGRILIKYRRARKALPVSTREL